MVSDQFNPVIFDLGSSTVRAGWAGHDQPKFVESSYMGRRISDDSLEPSPIRFLNGGNVKRHQSSSPSPEPVDVIRAQGYDGKSFKWTIEQDCLSLLSETLLFSPRGLETKAMERPLFCTHPTGASPDFKRMYYEYFMESVEVPAFFLGDTSVLALYAAGRTNGVCVDIGASCTTIARIEKGGVLVDSSVYAVGGDSIDQFITSRIDIEAPTISGTESYVNNHKLAIAREIKHNACKCSHHPLQPVSPSAPLGRTTRGSSKKQVPVSSPVSSQDPILFKLPDGSEVDVSSVQEYAAESLFSPWTHFPGLTAATLEKTKTDDDFILLTGGSAHFHGLHTRLVHELESKRSATFTVFPFAQWTHRMYSSFLGASILASLSTFGSLWVTPASYLENGVDRLVHSK